MARLNLTSKDSIYLRSGEAKLNALIGPDKKDKKVPHIESDLYFESVIAGDKANIASLKKAGFKMASSQSKTNKKHWISNGDIGFESLKMFTREFPLLITMPTSHISLEDDMIRLHNAGVNIGNSDLKMQGSLSNLYETIFNNGTLKGTLKVSSDFIDCNQIMKALEFDAEKAFITADNIETAQTAETTDEIITTGVFVVPDKIDFNLVTDIKNVKFGKKDIENSFGDMSIKNQAVELSNLSNHTLAADIKTSLVYKASDAQSAHTGFDLDMKDIRVGKLVELIPAHDTLVQMLSSLDGTVNIRIAAKAEFDENGRASCRDRVCQNVKRLDIAAYLNQNLKTTHRIVVKD